MSRVVQFVLFNVMKFFPNWMFKPKLIKIDSLKKSILFFNERETSKTLHIFSFGAIAPKEKICKVLDVSLSLKNMIDFFKESILMSFGLNIQFGKNFMTLKSTNCTTLDI